MKQTIIEPGTFWRNRKTAEIFLLSECVVETGEVVIRSGDKVFRLTEGQLTTLYDEIEDDDEVRIAFGDDRIVERIDREIPAKFEIFMPPGVFQHKQRRANGNPPARKRIVLIKA